LALRGGYVKHGFLVGGPFQNSSSRREQWHRLKAIVTPLASDAHLQLFLFTSGDATPLEGLAAGDPPWNQGAVDLTTFIERHRLQGGPLRQWCQIALDSPECLIPGDSLDYVWVGAALSGDGRASAALSQMRMDFDYQTYLRFLPAIYQEDPLSRQFLIRLLSLLTGPFGNVEQEIANLARVFDPAATPSAFEAWLAGWLGLALNENWNDEKRRQAIAGAFQMYALRGTTEGLGGAVRFLTGMDVHIDEPILNASWWSLPADEGSAELQTRTSILGFTTMLASAEPQGAVVGTTAILDQSHLIDQDAFGGPLFTDVVHQFSVLLYRGRFYSEQRHGEVRAALDQEKPAHTAYHLCVVEPRMRIGFQARVGIDSVVAGPILPTALTDTPVGGGPLILAGDVPGRMGNQSRIGRTTRLGEGTVEAQASA